MKSIFLDRGIILPSGAISKDKVNLVAGAITQPFAEMVWVTTGGDLSGEIGQRPAGADFNKHIHTGGDQIADEFFPLHRVADLSGQQAGGVISIGLAGDIGIEGHAGLPQHHLGQRPGKAVGSLGHKGGSGRYPSPSGAGCGLRPPAHAGRIPASAPPGRRR